jgi:hypothetical protein
MDGQGQAVAGIHGGQGSARSGMGMGSVALAFDTLPERWRIMMAWKGRLKKVLPSPLSKEMNSKRLNWIEECSIFLSDDT